jgi:hypothetical protein
LGKIDALDFAQHPLGTANAVVPLQEVHGKAYAILNLPGLVLRLVEPLLERHADNSSTMFAAIRSAFIAISSAVQHSAQPRRSLSPQPSTAANVKEECRDALSTR